MILEILDGLGRPLVVPATRVIVRSLDGTPLAAVVEWEGGLDGTHVTAVHAKDPQFNQVLANLGLDRVTVDMVKPKGIKDYEWKV
jgi:hypothetical protein